MRPESRERGVAPVVHHGFRQKLEADAERADLHVRNDSFPGRPGLIDAA